MRINKFYPTLVVSFAMFQVAHAAENYTLFNPTPDNKMRQMETERATASDGTMTVNPGRFQVETGFIGYTKDKNCTEGTCTKTTRSSFGDVTTLRLGLTENTEIQLMASSLYLNKKTTANNSSDRQSGFGSTTIRFKYSIGGNTLDRFAFALIPFIKFPTNKSGLDNNDVEGGVGVPFEFNFSKDWSIGGMSRFYLKKDQASLSSYRNSYYLGYANAIYVSNNITDKFHTYVEYYTYKANLYSSHWENTANLVLEYYTTDNFKIDGGVNVGVTKYAPDYVWFTGFAYRL